MFPLRWTRNTTLAALSSALIVQGCQTTPQRLDQDPPPRIGTEVDYAPANISTNLQFGSGPYPTLFEGSSTCMLEPATPIPTPAPPEAAPPVADPETGELMPAPTPPPFTVPSHLIFYMTLVSAFEDSSIAYDAVGLRGVQTYLLLPDGTRIQPTEKVVDEKLVEQPKGALRTYARSVKLYFPRAPMSITVPQPGYPTQGLRLVIEGYGALFFFEWPPQLPVEVRSPPLRQTQEYQNLKEGLRKTRGWAKETAHTFD